MSEYLFLLINKTDIVYDNKFIKFIQVLKSILLKKFKASMMYSLTDLDEMHKWISEYVKNNKDNLNCSNKDKSILCNKPNLFVINFCLLVSDLNKYQKFEEIDLNEIKNNSKITCANYINDCSNNSFEDNTFYNDDNDDKIRCACGKMVKPKNITYIKKDDIRIQFGDVCIEKTGIITKKEIKQVKIKYEKRNNLIQKWAIITNNLLNHNKRITISIAMTEINNYLKKKAEYRACEECLELKVPKNKPHWNKACLDCYYKKTQVPLNKCLISIKKN